MSKQVKAPKKATKLTTNPVQPKAPKLVAKSSKKDTNYDPDLGSGEEDYDHIIDTMEIEVSQAPTQSKLKISDYIDDEAEEVQPKEKKTKSESPTKIIAKSWSAGEAALLKVLIVGTPPLGRNSSGIDLLYYYITICIIIVEIRNDDISYY